MKKTYIGITIGPIFDTMDFVSSPSALWASSFMFSYISKSICTILTERNAGIKIVTPYFKMSDKKSYLRNDGVGLYHDRIIFEKPDGFDIKSIDDIKNEVIDDISQKFNFGKTEYLKEYIMIAAVEAEAENPIIEISPLLDSLELSKSFVATESSNPILNTFTSVNVDEIKEDSQKKKAASRNDEIKRIVKENLQITGWQLFKDGEKGIKDLGDIAHCDDADRKYNDYCAIVRADGDRIGKIIENLECDQFTDFSETCFKYCSAAAELVKKYNGVTIYSGGDDLLAILPCKSSNSEVSSFNGTVFDFAEELSGEFNKSFEKYIETIEDNKPSLSIGILMFYKKYPLYEALSESVGLLFGTAKEKRNCTAISLQKHSGQSSCVIIPNQSMQDVIKLKNEIISSGGYKKEEALVSVLHKLSLFENLFERASSDKQIDNLFTNIFDASEHQGNDFLHKILPQYYNKLRCEEKSPVYSNVGSGMFADTFSMLMRIIKFYLEKKGEK